MLAALLNRRFAKFESHYGYDTAYMRELAEIDAVGALKLGFAKAFTSHRFGLPANVYFAAKVTGTKWADCGSCLRLVIDMAVEAGVPRLALAALLTGSGEVPPDMALAARYASAVIRNDPELPEIIAQCEENWGRNGVAGLAAATVSGLFYPLFKRGMGYGNACEPIVAQLLAESDKMMEKTGA
jgi:hypothetical protein